MTAINWSALATGLVVGAAMSAIYFSGLAFGIRIARAAARPTATLMLSAAIRITLLLVAGWAVAQSGAWAFVGYSFSFLLLRSLAITLARSKPPERTKWS